MNEQTDLRPEPHPAASLKRRGLLRFGTLATAFTGMAAISSSKATAAESDPGAEAQAVTYVPTKEKGVASGVATLDVNAKVPTSQLPDFSSRFGAKLDLVSKLAFPLFVSHRGGPSRYPEQSMEGFRASAAAGFPIELDVQALADGTLVCLHDGSVDRTMTGATGWVGFLNREQWLNCRVRPAIPGGAPGMPVLWDDILAEFGGRTVVVAEYKATNLAVAQALIDSIVERGLERCVIFAAFDYTACKMSAKAGIATMLYRNDLAADPAALAADGIEFYGVSQHDPTYFSALRASGVKPLVFTINKQNDAQYLLNTRGAWGIISDDPWNTSGRYPSRFADPFPERIGWVGNEGAPSGTSFVFTESGSTALRIAAPSDTSVVRFVEQGWAGPLQAKALTIEWDSLFTEAQGTVSPSARIYLSTTLHRAANEGQPEWAQVTYRPTGAASGWARQGGTSASLLPNTPGFLPIVSAGKRGVKMRLRLRIDASGVLSFTRLDTGATLTAPALAIGLANGPLWLTFAVRDCAVDVSNVTIAQG